MKLLDYLKSKFKKSAPAEPESIDVNKLINESLKSKYKDIVELAKMQKTKLASIDETEKKLKEDIAYYERKKKEGLDFIEGKISEAEKNIEHYEKIKADYDERQAERNKSDVSKAIESYNTVKLTKQIRKYGFDVDFKQIGLFALAVIGVPTAIAYISQLKWIYIAIVATLGFISTPAIIYAFYKQKFNERRFDMVIDYLTNILPIFMQKAKITYALKEVSELVQYQMKDIVDSALLYINENIDDTHAERTALDLIESEFPNSRIKAVHDLMETVEFRNSTNFKDVCQDMYVDIDAWIRRVSDFQQDIRDRRNKLIILCGITLAMNCIFVFLYTGNEYFLGFTNNTLYQISTAVFIIAILLVVVAALVLLNGSWLINDMTVNDEEGLKKAYKTWEEGQKPIKKAEIALSIISIAAGAYYMTKASYIVALSLFGMGAIILTTQRRKYTNAYKKLVEHYSIEFPNWLRQITLNLHTQTVINAIEESQYTASYPMYRQLENFLRLANEDPTSIKPYSEMLHEFGLKDAQSSLKVLYSIQTYGQDEIKDQVSSLVTRNQAMLDKAESMKNQSNLFGVEALGYLPMAIFSISMVVNMFLLFSHLMSMLSSSIEISI